MKRCLCIAILGAFSVGAAVADGRVDLNEAGAEQLAAMLNGVGEARAAAIIEYRDDHGGFKDVDQLTQVSGIGETILDNNRELLTVSD